MPHQLPFNIQSPVQTQWSWAAVASSIAEFYSSRAVLSQCRIVNEVLGLKNCCLYGGSGVCNIPHFLEDALRHLSHWRDTSFASGSWDRIEQELKESRPIAVLIHLIGGGGHFVSIIGNGTLDSDLITVEDPYSGRTTTTRTRLGNAFHGSWSETYFTRP